MATDKDVKEMLLAYLKELHLPAFRSSYEELARQAQQEALSYEQYLLGLAQRECQERQHKRVERLLQRVAAAAGEELADVGPEASAGQGGAAGADPAGGLVRGSARERAGVRPARARGRRTCCAPRPGTGA